MLLINRQIADGGYAVCAASERNTACPFIVYLSCSERRACQIFLNRVYSRHNEKSLPR